MNMRFVKMPSDEERLPQPTHIYVLACERFVKIGVAIDVEKRRATLQFASPHAITTIASRLYPEKMQAILAERAIHKKFAEFRTYGEWFTIAVDDAVSAIMGETI